MWPCMQQQHWDWAIPAYATGYEVEDLADTTNIQHTEWVYRYPLVPARCIVEGPNYRDGRQPMVDKGYLWDMI